jgi:hypothetical protein
MNETVGVWHENDEGTNNGASAVRAAEVNRQHFVTRVSGHSDLDTIIRILDGTSVIWEVYMDVSATGGSFSVDVGVIPITPGQSVTLSIVSSTIDCHANMTGFSRP